MARQAYCDGYPVDARQLAMGVKVEAEHTRHIKDKRRARKAQWRLACDHLAPAPRGEGLPDYYTRLAKLEREARAAERRRGRRTF